jgi:lipase
LCENPKVREEAQEPKLIKLRAGDLTLAAWDWPGEDPVLLFLHATSFHGRCWDAVIRQFPGRHCVAIESRGHGRSSKPAPPYHWGAFTGDLLSILDQLAISNAIGIGHSMGGHTLAAAAAARPGAFSGLVLADPTIRPPEAYQSPAFDVAFVRKRRARWSSPKEMFDSFRGRPPFDRWVPEILHDYCGFGLLPDEDAFVLACPPEVEASIYECSKEEETRLYGRVGSVAIPVIVLRAGYSSDLPFSNSPTDPKLASRFQDGEDLLLPELTHFIPMEAPGVVADSIRRAAAAETTK